MWTKRRHQSTGKRLISDDNRGWNSANCIINLTMCVDAIGRNVRDKLITTWFWPENRNSHQKIWSFFVASTENPHKIIKIIRLINAFYEKNIYNIHRIGQIWIWIICFKWWNYNIEIYRLVVLVWIHLQIRVESSSESIRNDIIHLCSSSYMEG